MLRAGDGFGQNPNQEKYIYRDVAYRTVLNMASALADRYVSNNQTMPQKDINTDGPAGPVKLARFCGRTPFCY